MTKKFERQCPSCHGMGGEKDVILDDGTGPIEECGFCNATGRIKNKKRFYMTLGYVSWEKRRCKAEWLKKIQERKGVYHVHR